MKAKRFLTGVVKQKGRRSREKGMDLTGVSQRQRSRAPMESWKNKKQRGSASSEVPKSNRGLGNGVIISGIEKNRKVGASSPAGEAEYAVSCQG